MTLRHWNRIICLSRTSLPTDRARCCNPESIGQRSMEAFRARKSSLYVDRGDSAHLAQRPTIYIARLSRASKFERSRRWRCRFRHREIVDSTGFHVRLMASRLHSRLAGKGDSLTTHWIQNFAKMCPQGSTTASRASSFSCARCLLGGLISSWQKNTKAQLIVWGMMPPMDPIDCYPFSAWDEIRRIRMKACQGGVDAFLAYFNEAAFVLLYRLLEQDCRKILDLGLVPNDVHNMLSRSCRETTYPFNRRGDANPSSHVLSI